MNKRADSTPAMWCLLGGALPVGVLAVTLVHGICDYLVRPALQDLAWDGWVGVVTIWAVLAQVVFAGVRKAWSQWRQPGLSWRHRVAWGALLVPFCVLCNGMRANAQQVHVWTRLPMAHTWAWVIAATAISLAVAGWVLRRQI